jgi:ABC-type nitrate/sulfonate/bicarbonate transport system permease component
MVPHLEAAMSGLRGELRLASPARSAKWPLRLVSLGVVAAIWELFSKSLHSLLLPTFTETIAALARLLVTPRLWEAIWISNQAMVIGFALAALVGIALGFLTSRWRAAERFLDPYFSILLVTPVSALAPVMIMATGLGIVTRVLVVFTFAVVIVAVNTRAGVRSVDPALIEMARSFGASEWQLWRTVLVRGALPAILAGLRLGLGRAISGMVFVELLLLAVGIGRLMIEFQGDFDAAGLYATVLVVILEAVALMYLFEWFERRSAPWAGQVVVE